MPENDRPAAPVVAETTPKEVTLDLGDGNIMNLEQAKAMKAAKEGLETTLKDTQGTLGTVQADLEKMRSDYTTANQARIISDAARETAEARFKEANLKTEGWVSPEQYGQVKNDLDLMTLKSLSDRIDTLSATYNIDKSKFNGKTVGEIDAMEEAFKIQTGGRTPAPPKVGDGNAAAQGGRSMSEHAKAKETIESIWPTKK